jgi:oxygen-independent coproporphyrinogen-3 oxidase
MTPYSLYLHIPFCIQRCGYCDFNTYAGLENLIPDYVEALCAEIAYIAAAQEIRNKVHTIFFGGGTPSLLPINALERILRNLEDNLDLQSDLEITLEANPGTLALDYLRNLRRLGINRLSLGMQSAHPGELRLLERLHTYPQTIQAVAWARLAGFDNLNLDMIFGLPGGSLDAWKRSLDLALGLNPNHFSLYALSVEPGTPLGLWVKRGLLPHPDADLAAEMYEWASARLEQYGYTQYEISNWAFNPSGDLSSRAPRLACRHNLQYWRNLPYLGFGAGAHGFAAGVRTANLNLPQAYIQRMREAQFSVEEAGTNAFPRTPATEQLSPISREDEISETMLMGLRLTLEGVPASVFEDRFGQSLEQIYAPQIERLCQFGLLEWASTNDGETTIRLTKRGRLLGNQVFMEFIQNQ